MLIADGRPIEPLVVALISSPEYIDQRCDGRPDLFLENVYRDALGRDIDPGALAYYEQLLANGASPSTVASRILVSGEYIADYVDAQFQRLLNRAADPGGLAALAVDLSSDSSTESVLTLIAELPAASDFFKFITQ